MAAAKAIVAAKAMEVARALVAVKVMAAAKAMVNPMAPPLAAAKDVMLVLAPRAINAPMSASVKILAIT